MCAGAPGLAKRPLFKGKGDGGHGGSRFALGSGESWGQVGGEGANTPTLLSLQASDTSYPITFPFNITNVNRPTPHCLVWALSLGISSPNGWAGSMGGLELPSAVSLSSQVTKDSREGT